MKGLIYKDFLCLKKTLQTFIIVTISVLMLAVLVLLSSKYGNLAQSVENIQTEIDESWMDQIDAMNVCETGVWFMLLIPILFGADVVTCFKEDSRAGFAKMQSALALSHREIVGSRYLTALISCGAGVGASLLATLIISCVAQGMKISFLFQGVLSMGAIFLIYININLFLFYLFGTRFADLVQTAPIIVLLLLEVVFMKKTAGISEAELTQKIMEAADKAEYVLEHGYKVCVPLMLIVMVLSYLGSVAVVSHRRRVI